MNQADLFGAGVVPHFDGDTYEPKVDYARLKNSLMHVAFYFTAGKWRTLGDVRFALERRGGVKSTEAAISARIRDLRKPKFAGVDIERRRVTSGLFEYRCAPGDLKKLTLWLAQVTAD